MERITGGMSLGCPSRGETMDAPGGTDMRDQTTNTTASPSASQPSGPAKHPAPAGGQITVPASLLDAVMEVDQARDEGGLGLQEALVRMHDELAPLIAARSDARTGAEVG